MTINLKTQKISYLKEQILDSLFLFSSSSLKVIDDIHVD